MSQQSPLTHSKTNSRATNNQHIFILAADPVLRRMVIKNLTGVAKLEKTAGLKVIDKDMTPSIARPLAFGTIKIDSGEKVDLLDIEDYTQLNLRSQFWTKHPLGAMLFVDMREDEPLDNMVAMLVEFWPFIKDLSLSIGVINNHLSAPQNLNQINRQLKKSQLKVPVYEVESNNQTDLSLLLQSMLVCNIYGAKCSAV